MSDKITEEMMSKLSVDDTNSALLLQNILKLFMTRPKPMTEEEIVQYLKTNRNIGVVFGFMPEEVKNWSSKHSEKLCWYDVDCWSNCGSEKRLYADKIYALPDDFKVEEKSEVGWVVFNIIDGYVEIENTNRKVEGKYIEKFAWYDWQGFLSYCKIYGLPYVNFGGWQYALCKTWFMTPQIDNSKGYQNSHNDTLDGECSIPATPSRVRFWRVVSPVKTHDDSIDLALNG